MRGSTSCTKIFSHERCLALDIQQGKKIIILQENDAEGTVVAEDEELLFI
jgi:hypothetical protein